MSLRSSSARYPVLRNVSICGCETVITGEGRLDTSSLEGKLPIAVARRARSLGFRVIGRFGCRGDGWREAAALFDEVSFESEC